MGDDVAIAFVDTNLDTHIFITPPLNITVGELKKYVEKAHFSVFPDMGEIQATGILVKREGRFYLLFDSVIMKSVFPGVGETWYLRVEFEATHLSQHHQHDDEPTLVDDAIPVTVKDKRNKPTRTLPSFKRQLKSFRKTSKRKNRRRSVGAASLPLLVKGSGVSPAEDESQIKGSNYVSDSDV